MIHDYNTTDGTGTYYYDRYDYFNSTTSTASTSIPWRSPISTQYRINTYTIGQESYYDPYHIQRCLESYGRRNQYPYQQEDQTPCQEPQPQQVQKTPTPEQLKAEADAKERARALLLEYLDNENKQRLLDNKPLEIASKLFNGIKYRMPISRMDKIEAVKDNKVVTRLCLLVKEHETLPIEDVVLTKLLHVLNDERNMLGIANHSSVQENLLAGLN